MVISDPVFNDSGSIERVFPILNIRKGDRKDYLESLYLGIVKIFSVSRPDIKVIKTSVAPKTKRDITTYISYSIGIIRKECTFKNEHKINEVPSNEYEQINNAMYYLFAKVLYEDIEKQAFLKEMTTAEEIIFKKVDYYIRHGYKGNLAEFLQDFINSRTRKIESKLLSVTTHKSLAMLESDLRDEVLKSKKK